MEALRRGMRGASMGAAPAAAAADEEEREAKPKVYIINTFYVSKNGLAMLLQFSFDFFFCGRYLNM